MSCNSQPYKLYVPIFHKIPDKAFNCPTYLSRHDYVMNSPPLSQGWEEQGSSLTGALVGKGIIYHLFGYSGLQVYEENLIMHSILLFNSKLGSILIYSLIPLLKVLLNNINGLF